MLQDKIYNSFLDDASFSYEQRLYLINDPEYYWKYLQNIEMQSNKIVCSFFPEKNPKALEFCLNVIESCSAGELYIILVIFLRSKAYDEIYKIIEKPDFIDSIKIYYAVSDALKYEATDEFIEILSDKMLENHNYIPLVLEICGFKRIKISEEKLDFIIKNSEEKKRIVRYLGKVKRYSIDFTELMKTDNDPLFHETAIAIMRIQNESLQEEFYNELHSSKDWALIIKSLTGREEFVEEIYQYFKEKKSKDSVLAVALTGRIKYVPDLIECLEREELKEISALSLHILTGAGIEENVFIYEEIDKDILFDDELERLENGEDPYKEDKPGEKVTIISQNPLNWQKWWDDNKNRFNNGRYRLGVAYSAVPLIEMLKANLPAYIRQLAYEELSIHFGVDIVFETDMFVKDQIKAIDEIERTL